MKNLQMPEFYVTFARKIFFPISFGGEHVPLLSVSYAYA